MTQQIALISGSTGLIGNHLLSQLVTSNQYQEIHSISRKKPSTSHQIVQFHTVDFEELDNYSEIKGGDDAFCCLGTTMKKAGSKEAFYKVDFEFVKKFAELSLRAGCKRFFLVSALGADKKSLFYYNQVKGEIEEEVSHLPFDSVHIFRPSLLLGDRAEARLGENIGKAFAQVFSLIIPKKYKAIEAETVARAMLNTALKPKNRGIHFHESSDMLEYA